MRIAAPYLPPSAVLLAGTPEGAAGIFHSLRIMRGMIDDYKSRLEVIDCATDIIRSVPQFDELGEVDALFRWVRDRIRYVRDVHGIETIATPTATLARRAGDCDDQCVLLGALCESVGYPTRFVVAGYGAPGVFEHVYLEILAAGRWLAADPTERVSLGWEPPGAVIVQRERVST